MVQSDHVTKLYINSFMQDNFFNLQNSFMSLKEYKWISLLEKMHMHKIKYNNI